MRQFDPAHLHRFGLGQLQCGHPRLALHLVRRLDVERLRAAVGDHERARVNGVDEGAVQRDGAAARVRHLRLVPVPGVARAFNDKVEASNQWQVEIAVGTNAQVK